MSSTLKHHIKVAGHSDAIPLIMIFQASAETVPTLPPNVFLPAQAL